MRKTALMLSLASTAFLSTALESAQVRSGCVVRDLEEYYGEDLDEEYKVDREALAIAQGLLQGPLMKDAKLDSARADAFRTRFSAERDMELEALQELVRRHLYSESSEFRDLWKLLTQRQGSADAAAKIRDSIYEAYGYSVEESREAALDACLIANERAHLVVTKAIVDFMERRNLD